MKRKILPIFLSMALCFGASMTAFAADGDTNSENQQSAETVAHSYIAYQIFTGDVKGNAIADAEFGTGVTETMKTELAEKLGITSETIKAKEVAEKIGELTEAADIDAVSDIIRKNLSDVSYKITDGKVENGAAGYYMIVDVTDFTGDEEVYLDRAQLQLVEEDLAVEITEKRDSVVTEKKVKDINDSTDTDYTDWQDSADYDIGDVIPFELYATVPANYDDYSTYEYIFRDKQSAGLDFNASSVVVKVDGEQISEGYTVNETVVVDEEKNDVDTFQVVFADLKKIEAVKANSKITVEYTSTLNADAVIGATGNPNKMRVEFSNDKGGKGKTPWDTVIVFTFKTVVNKVDAEGKSLEGAEFALEKLVKGEDGKEDTWVLTESQPTLVGNSTEEGKSVTFTATGLDDGIYRITETKAPQGYNKIDPIYFVVAAGHTVLSADPALESLAVTDLDGEEIVATEANEGDLGTFNVDQEQGEISTSIVNQKGAVLPSTGGIGTTIFYVIGGVLVVGAVVLLIVRRKMRTEEE